MFFNIADNKYKSIHNKSYYCCFLDLINPVQTCVLSFAILLSILNTQIMSLRIKDYLSVLIDEMEDKGYIRKDESDFYFLLDNKKED